MESGWPRLPSSGSRALFTALHVFLIRDGRCCIASSESTQQIWFADTCTGITGPLSNARSHGTNSTKGYGCNLIIEQEFRLITAYDWVSTNCRY